MDKKKVALVTGAATGIGRACSVRLAKDGFNLVLLDWNDEECKKTVEMCKVHGKEVDFVHTDMGIESEVISAVAFVMKKYDHIDFFFNNHGKLNDPKLFDDITEEDIDLVIHCNFKGCFFGMKHVIKVMKAQGYGNILNTASSSGIRPETGFAVYSASKHAVIGLTKAAAIECGKYNIRVNAICPGGILTPMVAGVGEYCKKHPEFEFPRGPWVPLNRMAQAEELTGLVSMMASDDSGYMTGSVISIDGGLTQ
ncbi:MAG: SDR family NAD(P)-dependent oxidoreductase [Oscillospiraceae bacterium]